MTEQDIAKIKGFHAHVYYDDGTRETAARLRDRADAGFDVVLGRWHGKPVGPHPVSIYQIAFATDPFERFVPWLMLNHEGLSVLVRPETGDDVADHTDHAIWIGDKQKLDIDALRRLEANQDA